MVSYRLRNVTESTSVNVGGLYVERCSPAMKHMGVGAAIVVRGWESQPQGEGRQGIDVVLV
jgi:hypothetical protein